MRYVRFDSSHQGRFTLADLPLQGSLSSSAGTGRFKSECTSWIADSIGNTGRKGELAGMWPGTRSERANLPAIRRERTLLLMCCDNQRHIPP